MYSLDDGSQPAETTLTMSDSSMRILLIDDCRDETSPNVQRKVSVIARNYWEGIKQLLKNGPWDLLLLDHDLSSYESGGLEKTGYDVVCFLERYPEYLPTKTIIVSSNPSGRDRMKMVLDKLYANAVELKVTEDSE